MKKIISLLFVFAILLTGCDNTTTHAAYPLPIPAGTLTVSNGSWVTPADHMARQGSLVKWNSITISAQGNDVTVNGITIESAGYAENAAFTAIVLLDENDLQVGAPQTLDNYTKQTTIGGTFVVPKNTTKTFVVATVMANDLTLYAGQVAGLVVVGVNAENVTGLPQYGQMLTLVDTSVCSDPSTLTPGITSGVGSQTLGTYSVTSSNGPNYVQTHVFHIAVSTESANNLPFTNLDIYDETGAIVAGPVDAVIDGATTQRVTFTDTVSYADGTHTYTLKGKAPWGMPYGTTLSITSNINSDWRNISNFFENTPELSLDTSTMTPVAIQQNALLIETSPASFPDFMNVLAGSTGQEIGVIRFTAINNNMTLTEIPLTVLGTANIMSLSIWDEDVMIGAMPINANSNPLMVMALLQPVAIPAGTNKDLTVKVDLHPIGSGYPGTDGALVRVDATSSEMHVINSTTGNYALACGSSTTFGVNVWSTLP